jgi:hypothetical protein
LDSQNLLLALEQSEVAAAAANVVAAAPPALREASVKSKHTIFISNSSGAHVLHYNGHLIRKKDTIVVGAINQPGTVGTYRVTGMDHYKARTQYLSPDLFVTRNAREKTNDMVFFFFFFSSLYCMIDSR